MVHTGQLDRELYRGRRLPSDAGGARGVGLRPLRARARRRVRLLTRLPARGQREVSERGVREVSERCQRGHRGLVSS